MAATMASFFISNFDKFDQFLAAHIYFAPIFGAICGAILTVFLNSIVLVSIAKIFTKRAQMVTATFEFNKKYHELIEEGHKLSDAYSTAADDAARADVQRKAFAWWVKYFDFNIFELQFYREGFFVPERFIEYMQWRRLEFQQDPLHIVEVAAINYPRGWQHFSNTSGLSSNAFIVFLNEIHHAKTPRRVRWIVKNASSTWRWRIHRGIKAIAEML